jgi:site-specific DNA recombinase
MKVIIYNRKSLKDKEDQQILSIQGQKEENERRVKKEGHTVIASFDEECTAKKPGRPDFNEMLQLIETGKAEAIICWRLNRLARNPIDGGRVQWLLQQGVIKAIITSEKTYTPLDNVIQMAVEFGMATQFSIDLSKDVKRGMRQKAAGGWRPGRPTLGYMRDDLGFKGEKVVNEDLDRFPLVRQMWDELLTGAYTISQIWERAMERGMTRPGSRREPEPRQLHISTLYKIFTNPFYYGMFEWDGKLYEGKHKPMITSEEFDRAQLILGNRGAPRLQHNDNPYAGLIRCGECGSMIVADFKHKFNKTENKLKDYTYFRCSKRRLPCTCTQKGSLDQTELEKQLMTILDAAEVPQSLIEWSLRKLQCSQEDKRFRHQQSLEHLQTELVKAEKKIDDLIDLRLESPSAFSPESFDRRMKALEESGKDIKKKLKDREAAAKMWRDDVLDSVAFLEGVRERFEKKPAERLEILHRLGQTLEMKEKEVTFKLAEPFSSFREAREDIRRKAGPLEKLNCSMEKAQKSYPRQFEKAVSIWSGLLETITTMMGGSRSLCL